MLSEATPEAVFWIRKSGAEHYDEHLPRLREWVAELRGATVRVEREGPVAVVTIDRPSARNAVDAPTAAALAQAFRAFDADQALAVAVLTGAGGTFCAGWDLKAIAAGGEMDLTEAIEAGGPMGTTRMWLSKPVIAAVEGHAVGGGFELALWCDLRVAARDAVFGAFNRRFGVPLVDAGTVMLPRIVGHGRAMDLILTGRAVRAEEALGMGLVTRVVEPGRAREEAVALGRELARFPQTAMRSDRLSAIEQWGLPEVDAVRNELRRGLDVIRSGETAEGAERFARGEGRHGTPAPRTEPA
jgi:enoyl-CoA hydratase